MRYALLAFALSLVACGTAAPGSGDAGTVTELPDGAPCASGEQFCGGNVCIPLANLNHCGACGVRCPINQDCQLRSGAYVCTL
jgi:hypothetical protein